ncbi:MAG: hypothetical protein RLZ42_1077 [Armatimonadota bacterium]|jgi:hypothetical protein
MTGVWLSASHTSLGSLPLLPNKVYLAPPGTIGILETSGDVLDNLPKGAQLAIKDAR